MLEAMPSDAISGWMAFDLIHHSDEIRAGAMVCATLANLMGDGKRHWREADFLPGPINAPEEESAENMKGALRAVASGRK